MANVFCGCNSIYGVNRLLTAPKSDTFIEGIETAIKNYAGGRYIIKTPKSATQNGNCIFRDLNADETDEALVTYSTFSGDKSYLHLAIIKNQDDKWKIATVTDFEGSNVENIEFCDLNGDTRPEIVFAYSIYTAIGTRLSVISYTDGISKKLISANYSYYTICDLNENGRDNLLLFDLDNTTQKNVCQIYGKNFKIENEIKINAAAKEVKNVTVSNGSTAYLYADMKAHDNSFYTEVIKYSDGKASAPLYKNSNIATRRYSDIPTYDIDADGTYEIPCQSKNIYGKIYYTDWKAYKKSKLTTKQKSILSKDGSFGLNITDLGDVTCISGSSKRALDFYVDGNIFASIIPKKSGATPADSEYFVAKSTDVTDYYAKVFTNDIGVTKSTVKDSIIVLNKEDAN